MRLDNRSTDRKPQAHSFKNRERYGKQTRSGAAKPRAEHHGAKKQRHRSSLQMQRWPLSDDQRDSKRQNSDTTAHNGGRSGPQKRIGGRHGSASTGLPLNYDATVRLPRSSN